MLFEYYKDEIVLNEDAMNNEVTLLAFDRFINASRSILKEVRIPTSKPSFFYKRNKEGASVLGIQLIEGDNEDLSNYLVYDCMPTVEEKEVYCNIDMHAVAKATDFALAFASRATDEVNTFFQDVETLIHRNGDPKLEFDYMQQIELAKKKKGIIGKLFQKMKNKN